MKSAIVQSVFDFALREINALETRIVKAEDDTDAMLWDQAQQVVAQLEVGLSQRALARQWINARTGEPYDERHVRFVRQVFERGAELTPRPAFRELYQQIANAKMTVHHSSETVEHYTPADILKTVRLIFGDIPDLDPCSNSHESPNVEARHHFTRDDDGLQQPWSGRVFMNPPYGDEIVQWIRKLREEWSRGGVTEAIALLPARPDTEWFELLTADTDDLVMCFLRGRVTFIGNENPAPFPSMLAYFGPKQDVCAGSFTGLGSVWMRPPLDFFVSHDVTEHD